MAEVIKTKYMDKATRGYSEYIARDLNALQTISPKEGDRAILLDGSLYICVDNGIWDIAGGAKETDILIITAGYKTGGERGYTIDKTYAEILSAAEAGKTIIMIDTTVITGAGLPVILYPYSYNSDGSGTFVTIAKGDDMGGSKDYRYSITVYPDNTVIPRWEDLSQQLDHTVTFTVDNKPYEIVSVKDGNSVNAPVNNPTSENGAFRGWSENESKVRFPYNVVSDTTLTAKFSKSSIYTISFDFSQQYPEYTYKDDAVGMLAGGKEWDEIFGIYPCLFADGEEVVKLNPNDFTKDINGNTVDITSGSMGDVMICFPRMDLNISMVNNIVTISLTDELNQEGYTHYAHQYNGEDKDKFYVGAYECGVIDNKMVSLSGLTPAADNLSNYRNYAKNKSTVGGYNVFSYYQLLYIQCLMILKYKSINSQEAVGYGICNGSFANTGLANSLGMNFGTTSNKTTVVKLFGLENLWANKYCWIDGVRTYNGVLQTSKFNFSVNNWEDVSPIPTSTYYGNPTKIIGNSEGGFFALAADGQSPISESNGKIRLGDQQNIGSGAYVIHGGKRDDGYSCGIFCYYVRYSAGVVEDFSGSRLMFI